MRRTKYSRPDMTSAVPPELSFPCTIHDLKSIFGGVTGQTIQNYRHLGMPRLARGRYDAIACLRWRVAFLQVHEEAACRQYRTALRALLLDRQEGSHRDINGQYI